MSTYHILAQAHAEGFMAEYTGLMVDKAHIAFELSWEIITGLIAYPIAKRVWDGGKEKAIRAHDAIYHPRHAHAVKRSELVANDAEVAA